MTNVTDPNERYRLRQAEYNQAWGDYQAAKSNAVELKYSLFALEKKYAASESGSDLDFLNSERKKSKNSEYDADILLDKASSIAGSLHRYW